MTDQTTATHRAAVISITAERLARGGHSAPAASEATPGAEIRTALGEPLAGTPSLYADPIFAAIAEHRVACAAYRQASWRDSHTKASSPKHAAAEEASDAAMEREGEVLEALLKCLPTTLAGVAAVLDHLSLPEFLIEGREGTGMSTLEGRFECESRAARKYPGRLAAAVRKIAGVAPPALPAPVSDDPIYAAIEHYRTAWDALGERASELDDLNTPESNAACRLLHEDVGEACDEIRDTQFTTMAGAIAVLRFVAEDDPFDDAAEFMQTVADRLEKIAVSP